MLDAVEHLVGMQAQEQNDPYVGLWSRLSGFDPGELAGLITGRRAIRAPLMRATIHLATTRDFLALRPVMQEVVERAFYTGSPFARQLEGVDFDELVAAGRALIDERPLSRAELRPLLHQRWPEHDAESLPYAITYLLPVVQVPPRGVWGAGGQARWTSAEAWLGQAVDGDPAPDVTVLRYLAAFGPATVRDFQTWSGLTKASAAFERLRPKLRTFRDENGRELFDVPGAPLPDPDTPAPVRFLPLFDNVLLSHADRSRIASAPVQDLLWGDRRSLSGVLVDGFLRGTWRIDRGPKAAATLVVRLGDDVSKGERVEVAAEAERLREFVSAELVDVALAIRP